MVPTAIQNRGLFVSDELEHWYQESSNAPIRRVHTERLIPPTTSPHPMAPQYHGPAGWHPDPTGQPTLRYFDGRGWTNHLAPMPPPAYGGHSPGVGVAVAVANGGGPNHALHAVLTLLTFGMWLPIWILVAIFGGRGNASAVSVSR